MITHTTNKAVLAQNTDFITRIGEYKALLEANGFPFTINVSLLRTTLQTQLFQKLLSVDKGLKLRWDMLRTDDARLKLIADTVDVEGYEVLEEAEKRVKGLESTYNRLYVRDWGYPKQSVPFAAFADAYELDMALLLDTHTYDFSGREHVLEYFRGLGLKLEELRRIFAAVDGGSGLGLGRMFMVLERIYTSEGKVSEGAVVQLIQDLERVGQLGIIPMAQH